jgi:predicted small metal-binding protein
MLVRSRDFPHNPCVRLGFLTAMKTMTCKSLGGPCEQKLSAGSWEEMVAIMTRHVIQQHPDTAKEMEKMHNQDPKKWGRETKPKWDAIPET